MKKREIYDHFANEKIDEIQDISNKIDFDILTYHFKGKNNPKIFIDFKAPLGFSMV